MKRISVILVNIVAIIILLLIISCERVAAPPYTDHTWISSIGTNKATANSRLVWDGETKIKECGFCWNTTGYPKKTDSFVKAEMTNDMFSATLTGLTDGLKYFVRSYAINNAGIYYGEDTYFTTKSYKLPSVSSPSITGVTYNTIVLSNGGITDNSYNVLRKGVCWSTTANPTINDSKLELEKESGSFGCVINGLEPGTVYFIRAYAENVVGISYGGNKVGKTFDGYTTDHEGHVYSTVKLGNQEWMNRNLETYYFSNGEKINTTTLPTTNIENEDEPVYQWAFLGHDEHPELLDDDGRLYTWYTTTDARKLCPAGWHIPTSEEWNELLVHLGGDDLTSRDFKWSFNYYWDSPLNEGNTEGSFNAVLAGLREPNGTYQYGSYYGTFWWTGTEVTDQMAGAVYCGPSDLDVVSSYEKNKKYGYSVRCIKDK